MKQAKIKEIENWKRNKVFDEVLDKGEKAINVRWVINEKLMQNNERKIKARLVAKGYEEKIEDNTDAPIVSAEAMKMILTIAKEKNWGINAMDITAAYLQGDKINRKVYIRPPREFNVGKLWRLNKTVYGLKDAAMRWYLSLKKQLIKLGLKQSKMEPTLFMMKDKNFLEGLLCTHVDDILWVGNKNFEENKINKLREIFKMGENSSRSFKYLGVQLHQNSREIIMDQSDYWEKVKINSINTKNNRKLNNKENKRISTINWKIKLDGKKYKTRFDVCS